MPLKVKAIINAIKGTPLCSGYLVDPGKRNSMHCVMGALLANVGATRKELLKIDRDHEEGYYWNVAGFQKFKPKLKRKFGIASSDDVEKMVQLNDEFSLPMVYPFNENEHYKKVDKERTCYIMKSLVKEEVRRIKKEEANAR